MPLGRLLGTSWSVSGNSWRVLGASCSVLGCSWSVLGASWSVVSSSWSVLGASWSQLGRSWVSLGPNLATLGRLLDPTWRLLGALGPNLAALGFNLQLLGSLWVSTWPFQMAPKRLCSLLARTACPACAPGLPALLPCPRAWPVERQAVHCTPICAAHPGLLYSQPCPVHPSLLVSLAYALTHKLPFELTQQLPVRTKLHLNFHNSCRIQLYIVASALLCRWISTGAR